MDEGENIVLIGYKGAVPSSDVVLNWEHSEHAWVNKEDVNQYKLTSDAKFVLMNYLNAKV